MLNVYNLSRAINESASGIYTGPCVPYNFTGSLDEATNEMNYILMTEAVEMNAFSTTADEIMTEAAVGNPATLQTLSESVFTSIAEAAKKFWAKLKEMVKGMITKIKAMFYQVTGKTNKWVSVMRSRIEAKYGKKEAEDLTVEIHKWERSYFVGKGCSMVVAIKAIAEDAIATSGNDYNFISNVKTQMSGVTSQMTANNQNAEGENGKKTSAEISGVTDKIKEESEKFKNARGDWRTERLTFIAQKFGVSGSSPNSIEDIWNAVAKKATGGEKTTVKISEIGASAMLDAVDKASETISDLKDAYEKHYNDIAKMEEKVKSTFDDLDKVKDADKYPAEIMTAYKGYVSDVNKVVTGYVTFLESVVNTAKTKNIDMVKKMCSEYMGALSKYAGVKAPKESK